MSLQASGWVWNVMNYYVQMVDIHGGRWSKAKVISRSTDIPAKEINHTAAEIIQLLYARRSANRGHFASAGR